MSLLNGISSVGDRLSGLGGSLAASEATRGLTPLLSRPADVEAPQAEAVAPAPKDTPTGGNALDAATIDRAHQVYLGLVQRGMDPATATGFAANAVQESRASPLTNPGDMGASHGLLQWRDDRLDRYVGMYGHAPEKGTLDEQLDYVMHELSGPEAKAWQAIQNTPANPMFRAAAISQYFERPKDTQDEIARRGAIANQLAGHFARMGGG